MDFLRDLFDSTPWLNLVFLILSIIGISLSFYFYYKSKRDKQPVFSKKTFPLVQQNLAALKNLEIKYHGRNVESLSLTKLAFWNAGKEPIRNNDLATNDPLLIVLSEGLIVFDVEINYHNKVNNFVIERINDHSIRIDFDFINYNDGIGLSIYHSGTKSSDISIIGTLIGAKKLSLGVKKNILVSRFDFVFTPVNYLFNQRKILPTILGFLAAILILFIMMPILIVVQSLDFLYDKLNYKSPKQFYLYDD